MRNSPYYRWFIASLTEQQLKDYREYSIDQQKDWYISYLERHYEVKKPIDKPLTVYGFIRGLEIIADMKESYVPDFQLDVCLSTEMCWYGVVEDVTSDEHLELISLGWEVTSSDRYIFDLHKLNFR